MENLNIGLVGTGFMGKGHSMAFRKVEMLFDNLAARPHLAVVADVTEDLARSGAERFGFDRWTSAWQDVVADPGVDIVDITTPNHLHREIAVAAARAGKHVYCEKPLAVTAADAKAMAEAATAAGVVTMVGFNYLKNPATLLARQIVESGEIGEVRHFRGCFHQDVLADPDRPFSWRFEKAVAGAGALGDLGAHVVEMARFLVGEIACVSGLTRTFIEERSVAEGAYGYEAKATTGARRRVENEDVVHFLAEFSCGATGVIESSRIASGRKVHLAYEVTGSRGALHFVHDRLNELNLYLSDDPSGRQGFRNVMVGPDHPYYRQFWPVAGVGLGYEDSKVIEIYELLEGVAAGRPVYPDFTAGWRVCQVIDAVIRSAEERAWIDVASI